MSIQAENCCLLHSFIKKKMTISDPLSKLRLGMQMKTLVFNMNLIFSARHGWLCRRVILVISNKNPAHLLCKV